MTRSWDHGLSHAPEGFDIVQSVSLAAPMLRRSSQSRLVVTVHDVAWRRHAEATTRRGLRWHEAALVRARDCGASLVVPSRLVAADLASLGVDKGRITVVPGGADHLPAPDPAAVDALAAAGGRLRRIPPHRRHARAPQERGPPRAGLRSGAPFPARPVAVGDRRTGRVGARASATPRGRWRRLHGRPSRSGARRSSTDRARAFAYVPLTEGYGLPPLEAMLVGTPTLVANEVPSVHDLHAPEPAPARIVDPLDVTDIAAGISRRPDRRRAPGGPFDPGRRTLR